MFIINDKGVPCETWNALDEKGAVSSTQPSTNNNLGNSTSATNQTLFFISPESSNLAFS